MKKGANGLPDPNNVEMFANLGIYPVDLKVGPGGDLFFVDIAFGQIRRITYTGDDNRAPTAHAEASPSYGPAPLEVGFDASGSTDPDAGDTLTYEWDLDGDGEFDDSTEEHPRVTYPAGPHEVTLKVTDSHGAHHTDTITINSGETPPQVSIDSPSESHKWHVGETINFSGSATDEQDGALPASALSWKLILNHCVTVDACHSHPVQDFDGRRQRLLHRARPRLPVAPAAAGDGHRLEGPEGHEDDPARPADGQPDREVRACRPERERRREVRTRPARA